MKAPKIQHHMVAFFLARLDIRPIKGRWRAPAGIRARRVEELPLLLDRPQWVRFADRFFHVKKEGLYRFWDFGRLQYESFNEKPRSLRDTPRYSSVILYRGDVVTLLSALAAAHYFGNRHDALPFERQLAHVKHGALSLTCGPCTAFVTTLLARLGWKTRPICLVRMDGPFNGHGDGHVLFEFYWPRHRKWVLADVSGHCLFTKHGRYLHAGEVAEIIRSGGVFERTPLAPPGIRAADATDAIAGKFCATPIEQIAGANPEMFARGLRSLFVMPMIAEGGHYHYYSDNPVHHARMKRYRTDIKAIPRAEWWQRFYGQR